MQSCDMKKRGLYLCAGNARFSSIDAEYNDIDPKSGADIIGNCMHVDLRGRPFVLASPPCNYWSRANINRGKSKYAQATKHLLPSLLSRLSASGIPFILENVRNDPLFQKHCIYKIAGKYSLFVYKVNRHTYFTNRPFCPFQEKMRDFKTGGVRLFSRKQIAGGKMVEDIFGNG